MASTPALLVDARAIAQPPARRWSTFFQSRKTILCAGDMLVASGAVLLLAVVMPAFDAQGKSPFIWTPLLLAVAIGLVRTLDAYDRLFRAHLRHILRRIGIAGFLSLAACAGLVYLWWPVEVERWPMARDALVLLGSAMTWRLVANVLLAQDAFRTRALVLTHGRQSRGLRTLLRRSPWAGYELAGFLDYGNPGAAITQHIDHIVHCVEREGAQLVIVDAPEHQESRVDAALRGLRERGIACVSLADVYESISGRALLGRGPKPVWPARRPRWDAYCWLQRGLDLVVATLGLALASPLLLVAAGAIVLDSPGRPLYWQARVGRGGGRFQMVKLRTMRKDAESDSRAVWASRADPRVTAVGKLLRPCHFDEIPQLWNVLWGDMSLVGPRPERPEFVELLATRVRLYNARHAVRPGITGWAQVQFTYAASVQATATKLEYDLFYINHRGPVLDLVILLKTLLVAQRLTGT
jgi:exopolysaccharide biosynthesis polyprenyl glycosylphosphotransferase